MSPHDRPMHAERGGGGVPPTVRNLGVIKRWAVGGQHRAAAGFTARRVPVSCTGGWVCVCAAGIGISERDVTEFRVIM